MLCDIEYNICKVKRMSDTKIIITVEGTEENGRDISLSDFSKIVDTCRKLIENSAKVTMGEKHMCIFLVSGLSHSSPASMEVTPVGGRVENPGAIITQEMEGQVEQIKSGDSNFLSKATLDGWESLASFPASSSVRKMKLEYMPCGDHAATKRPILKVDGKMSGFLADIKKARAVELTGMTSCIGEVKLIDLHGGGKIKVYPRVPTWAPVVVSFSPDKKAEVINAIDKVAKISGKGHYRSDSPLPYKMEMDAIDILPEAGAAPKLSEMRGYMSGMTDGKSVQEYLDDLRKEEG